MCLDRVDIHPSHVKNQYASPTHLVGEAEDLRWFKDGVLDYVYSSHLLEDFYDTKKVLTEWFRVIKPGGYLVLFMSDEQVYRSVTPEENRNKGHKHTDFGLEYMKGVLREMGFTNTSIVHELWPVPNNLYSFDLVVQKPLSPVSPDDAVGDVPATEVCDAVPKKRYSASFDNKRIIQMGRYGDIINILPIAKDIAEKIGKPVPIVCNNEYADILDGVSYAVAEPVRRADTVDDLLKEPGVLNAYATHPASLRRIPYNLQAWEQVGYADRFHELLPVFDRRCRIREIALVESLVTFEKPVMVVCLYGLSSVMVENIRNTVKKLIHESFSSQFQIVELNSKAHRPYDLLGLLDVASVVLTIDTMLLHLATASNVPVVAFLSNHPPIFWRASAVKGNVVYSTSYSDTIANWPLVVSAVEMHKRDPVVPRNPIYHVVPTVEAKNEDAARRYKTAAESWRTFHEQGAVFLPYHDQNALRLFTAGERKLPFLKDALKVALDASGGNNDIICFTNADIILTDGFYKALQYRMAGNDYCCAFRMEFEPTTGVRCGYRTCGRDVWAFKRLWLVQHFDEIPDFLIGVGGWDYALCMWLRIMSGRTPECCDPAQGVVDIEMEYGFVWHERHEAAWYVETDTSYAEAASHNRACIVELFDRIGLDKAHKDVK